MRHFLHIPDYISKLLTCLHVRSIPSYYLHILKRENITDGLQVSFKKSISSSQGMLPTLPIPLAFL